MSLPSFATQTLTMQRAPLIADHGSQVRDWASAVSSSLRGCSVQPGAGPEDQINRDGITVLWRVFAPIADVLPTDRAVFDGVTYDIDGQVNRFETGVLDHLEFTLKAVAG